MFSFWPWRSRRDRSDPNRPIVHHPHYARHARSLENLADLTSLRPEFPYDRQEQLHPQSNTMPYATPQAVAVLPPAPAPSSLPTSYALESNNSLESLNGIPRTKSSAGRSRLGAPSPGLNASTSNSTSQLTFPTLSSDINPSLKLTSLVVQPPTPERPRSPPKRVRGQRFTTAVGSSSSESHSSDEENASPSSKQDNMATVGRKRGEMMRHAATVDSSSLSGSKPTPRFTSPTSSSPVPPPTPATSNFYQAVKAGQPGILRLNMDAIKRARSTSPGTNAADPTPAAGAARPKFATVGPQFVRKKSGELVKPALRTPSAMSPSSAMSPGVSMSASASLMYRRNSAPSTPTPKNVHFDAQLEHVKLFLAEQKPAAVSRSGSPTAYGSTTEEEGYPWHGPNKRREEEKARGKLSIRLVDATDCDSEIDARGPYSKATQFGRDPSVKLESLVLIEEGHALRGSVIVRNIAYDKRVAARFTLDWWQTTSEVAAKYEESLSSSAHDRFSFTIRLGDLLPKITEKTLFLAIKYNVAGQELWDNNGHRNYQVVFERAPSGRDRLAPPRDSSPTKSGSPTKSSSPVKTASPTKEWEELRRELEKVVIEDDDDDGSLRRPVFRKDRGRLPLSVSLSVPSISSSPATSPAQQSSPSLSNGLQLSTRYDLSAALNKVEKDRDVEVWNPPALPSSPRLPWKVPFPNKGDSVSPQKSELVAPRMASAATLPFDDCATITRGRHHQRSSSYFDGWLEQEHDYEQEQEQEESREELEVEAALPLSASMRSIVDLDTEGEETEKERDSAEKKEVLSLLGLPRSDSYHAPRNLSPMSMLSTPSATSSSSPSESPSTPPHSLPMSPSGIMGGMDLRDPQRYSFFLDRFCFFTGNASSTDAEIAGAFTRRTHSESEVDNYFGGAGEPLMYGASTQSGHSTPKGVLTPRPGTPDTMSVFNLDTPMRR